MAINKQSLEALSKDELIAKFLGNREDRLVVIRQRNRLNVILYGAFKANPESYSEYFNGSDYDKEVFEHFSGQTLEDSEESEA
jgi:hypothetical protein